MLLHDAYELFGVTGATLWRFHTRSAVARRVSRLLARTGKRSRTELVTVVLTGSLRHAKILAPEPSWPPTEPSDGPDEDTTVRVQFPCT